MSNFRKYVKARSKPYTERQRMIFARQGKALPNGSFPIANRQDLANAIASYGRALDRRLAKHHIIVRAKALRLTSLLPDTWKKKL